MTVEAHRGSARWMGSFGKPGLRILGANLIGSQPSLILDGQTWNRLTTDISGADPTPNHVNFEDISGRVTPVGLRTLTAFTQQIGVVNKPGYGYPQSVFSNALYTSVATAVSEVEFYGLPKDHIVDLVLGGANNQSNDRGGTWSISTGKQGDVPMGQADVVIGNTGITGPVIFRGLEPVAGVIQLKQTPITAFHYWAFFDMLVYRR